MDKELEHITRKIKEIGRSESDNKQDPLGLKTESALSHLVDDLFE